MKLLSVILFFGLSANAAAATIDGGTPDVTRIASAFPCGSWSYTDAGWTCIPADAAVPLPPAWYVSQNQMLKLGQRLEQLETTQSRLAEENAALRANGAATPPAAPLPSFFYGVTTGVILSAIIASSIAYVVTR